MIIIHRPFVNVDMDSLKYDLGTINTLIETLESRLNKLYSQLTNLNSTWSGAAKDAFEDSYEKSFELHKQSLKKLKDMHKDMLGAYNDYVDAEVAVADMLIGFHLKQ